MDPATVVRTLVQRVESAPLTLHTAALPAPRHRPQNPALIRDALRYLRDRLRGYGWQVFEQPCYDPLLGAGSNVIASLPGTVSPMALVVVGAHHDTVRDSPGADDNGSGLAGLLELGRLLAARRWEATIQLIAFDFEESGLHGSRTYVESLLAGGFDLRGAFILEGIGYSQRAPGSQTLPAGFEQHYPQAVALLDDLEWRGNFLAVVGNERQPAFLDSFVEWGSLGAPDLPLVTLAAQAESPLRDLLRSDHLPFWEAGLPAVLLTDTANYRNPHYHQPSDQPGTLDPAFWRRVMMATLATVAATAGLA